MQDLNIALIQADLAWEDIPGNLEAFESRIESVDPGTHLVVLPEMFSTGFSMDVEALAETPDGRAMEWLRKKAAERGCVVAGSILTRDAGKYYNRFTWMRPDGTHDHYDKRHLFSMGGEDRTMAAGNRLTIVELNDWKACLQVCYDLRFPVWSRNTYDDGQHAYDLLIYVSNWPEARKKAYQALLPARAIENQAYVVWVNRVGTDGKGVYHSGDSAVYDPSGNVVAKAGEGKEEVLHACLSAEVLSEHRSGFRVGPDWDVFSIGE